VVGRILNSARQVFSQVASWLAVLAFLGTGSVACNETPATGTTTATPSGNQPLAVERLTSRAWLTVGQYGIGNLGCGTDEIAWTSSTLPISKSKQDSRNDVIRVASLGAPEPRAVSSAQHGGTLTDAVPVTGSWLVYMEYQQQGQSSSTAFWYLNAVDWANGRVVELASATTGPELRELPWYDAADGRAVWNQLDSAGKAILRIYDFTSGEATTLPLPADTYPVQPTISANSVTFVDNSTDPDRSHEDFFGRRGSLRRFDLTTQSLSTLSSDPTAWMPRARGGQVVWTAMPSVSPSVLMETQLEGGAITALGSDPVTPVTDGARVVWYDSHQLHFIAYGVRSHHAVELQVDSWQDVRSVFALCGNRLFFALPPALEGGSSTIRYVDLSATPV
jgi:hypothetical protein